MKIIGRSAGRSSTAASAYRAGIRIEDQRTGEIFDYSNKGKDGVLDHALHTPARAPDWAKEASSLWNNVELFEKRKDAQVARENIVALPHELTLEQNRELLGGFIQEAYIKRGAAVQADIHAPDKEGDNRNIHAHLLITTRQITRNGFKAKKPRNWNEKATLKDWRKLWEQHLNRALEKAGHEERVDSRSHEARGLDEAPSVHMGVEATSMERKGEDTRQGEKNKAVEVFNQNLAQLKEERKVLDLAIHREQAKQKNKPSKGPFNNLSDPALKQPDPEQIKKARIALEHRQREELYKFEQAASEARFRETERLKDYYQPEEWRYKLRQAERALKNSQGMFSKLTGKTRDRQEDVENLQRTIEGVKQRQKEGMSLFNAKIAENRQTLTDRHVRERAEFEKSPQPMPKTGATKTFEKAVLKKTVANENKQPFPQTFQPKENQSEPEPRLVPKNKRGRGRENGR